MILVMLTRGNVEIALLLVKGEQGKVHGAGTGDRNPGDHDDDDHGFGYVDNGDLYMIPMQSLL